MKIGLLHYAGPPIVGGVEIVIGHHARLMADAGHQVRILAGRGAPTDPRIEFTHIPLFDSLNPEVLAVKADLDRGTVPPGFANLVRRVHAELEKHTRDLNIIIAHNVGSLNKNLALTTALWELSADHSAPSTVLWHHDLAWTTPRYRAELHDGYPWDTLCTAWSGVQQVTISVVRQQELADLMSLDPDQILVIPNGIDIERFLKLEKQTCRWIRELHLLDADPLLLLPVRITRRKNIELALQTLAQLTDQQPHARLVITGPLGQHNPANIQYFNELRLLRAGLGLEKAAIFLAEHTQEFIPDEVIADLYRIADALFLPSREEGFGIPILEAGLSGLPLFCTDIPPLRELAGSEATYFSPQADPAMIAQVIQQRLQALEPSRMKERVRRSFTWKMIYQEHLVPLLKEYE
jgi:glycosyltransferase involved in cell wall biosynthesis